MLIWPAKVTNVSGLISYAMQHMSFLGLIGNMLLLCVETNSRINCLSFWICP